MSAIDTALHAIDQVAREGDLTPERRTDLLELDALANPIVLPDGKRIYPRGCTASRSTSSPAP